MDVLEWLMDHDCRHVATKGWDSPINLAFRAGEMPAVEWLNKHRARLANPESLLQLVLNDAAALVVDTTTDALPPDLRGEQQQQLRRLDFLVGRTSKELGDINATRCWGGRTVLHHAAARGLTYVCAWLLAHGARSSVNIPNYYGNTPLHAACTSGNVELCSLLRSHGAIPTVRHFRAACEYGFVDVCKWLEGPEGGVAFDPQDSTCVFQACRGGHLEVMRRLCSKGAAPMSPATGSLIRTKGRGDTPLHVACKNGHLEVAQFLLAQAPWLSPTTTDKRSACDDTAAVELNMLGELPLHSACSGFDEARRQGQRQHHHYQQQQHKQQPGGDERRRGRSQREALVQLLCDHGAVDYVNHASHNGMTPLALACIHHSDDVGLRDRLFALGAKETVSQTRRWKTGPPLHMGVVQWVVKRYGPQLDDAALQSACGAAMSLLWLREKQGEGEGSSTNNDQAADAVAQAMVQILRLAGPRVLEQRLPGSAPGIIFEVAARVGVTLPYLQENTRLKEVLEAPLTQTQVFLRTFLFGCRRSSGSAFLWLIGSKYALAGIRLAIAGYSGVICDPTEHRRLKEVHAQVKVKVGT